MSVGCRIAVLAKAPLPGYAKTRLIPALGAAGAAALAERLLAHAAAQAVAAEVGPVTVWAAPDPAHPAFGRLARRHGVDLRPQGEGDLGARMAHVFESTWRADPGPLLLKGDAHFAALARAVERAVDSGRVPGGQYLALLIDEAHDFEDAWLRIAGRMVSPATNSLLVLYDDAQSIYQGKRRRFNFASVGIEARGRTSILRLNYRNTTEVLALALQCAQGLLQGDGPVRGEDELPLVQPLSAGRRGALPVLVQARHAQEEADLLAERIAAALAGGTPAGDIAVLCRTKSLMRPIEAALARRGVPLQSMNALAFRRFDWRSPSVKLLTLHSAKGLEFGLVCVAGLQALPMRDETLEDAVRLLYVAMTRATRELVLSAHGRSAVVDRVHDALREKSPPPDADALISAAGGAGWEWRHYRPFVALALQHGLPIVAANVSREEARRVMAAGLQASGFDADVAPDVLLALAADIEDSHCGLIDGATARRMALAQVARDQAMAAAVDRHAWRGVLLLAGNGHVRTDAGVPRWLDPATRAKSEAIGLLEEGARERGHFDRVVLTAAQERADPCAGMRR